MITICLFLNAFFSYFFCLTDSPAFPLSSKFFKSDEMRSEGYQKLDMNFTGELRPLPKDDVNEPDVAFNQTFVTIWWLIAVGNGDEVFQARGEREGVGRAAQIANAINQNQQAGNNMGGIVGVLAPIQQQPQPFFGNQQAQPHQQQGGAFLNGIGGGIQPQQQTSGGFNMPNQQSFGGFHQQQMPHQQQIFSGYQSPQPKQQQLHAAQQQQLHAAQQQQLHAAAFQQHLLYQQAQQAAAQGMIKPPPASRFQPSQQQQQAAQPQQQQAAAMQPQQQAAAQQGQPKSAPDESLPVPAA
jgi:hypothetical protein